jgi:hypothetical protein
MRCKAPSFLPSSDHLASKHDGRHSRRSMLRLRRSHSFPLFLLFREGFRAVPLWSGASEVGAFPLLPLFPMHYGHTDPPCLPDRSGSHTSGSVASIRRMLLASGSSAFLASTKQRSSTRSRSKMFPPLGTTADEAYVSGSKLLTWKLSSSQTYAPILPPFCKYTSLIVFPGHNSLPSLGSSSFRFRALTFYPVFSRRCA